MINKKHIVFIYFICNALVSLLQRDWRARDVSQAELCNSNHGERIERNLGGRTTESRWRTAYTKMAAECLVAWNLILPHRSPGSDSGPLSCACFSLLAPPLARCLLRLSSAESSFLSSRTTSTITSRLGNFTAANYTRTPSIFRCLWCGNSSLLLFIFWWIYLYI